MMRLSFNYARKFFCVFIFGFLFSTTNRAQSEFSQFVSRMYGTPDSLKSAVVDSFMTYARTKGIPFIENTTASFIYRDSSAQIVQVTGDFNGWGSGIRLSRLSNTDLFYVSRQFELNARLDYKFIVDGSWILDPENPHRVSGGFGPNSELAMPDYVQPWEIQYDPNIPHGKLETVFVESKITGKKYYTRFYLPPGYDSLKTGGYPVAYFQDGGEYVTLGTATYVMDNLIAARKIKPLIAVFVSPPTSAERETDYAGINRFNYAEFFATELVPIVDSVLNTNPNRESRLVIGDSWGGNISAMIAYNYADVFGNCGLHSAAFWPNNSEVYYLITNGEKKKIKFVSVWGTYEGLTENMSDFRDFLLQNGYELEWAELPEGHSWGLWRANIDTILEFIYPPDPSSVDDKIPALPQEFTLSQNYPNPFNPTTKIMYSISTSPFLPPLGKGRDGVGLFVTLKVYDVLGNEITTLVNETQSPGTYEVEVDAAKLPSGVYFYRITAGQFTQTRKMILMK